jgi:hypothetical protein
MSGNDKYVRYATHCIEAAQRATRREDKLKFLEMAQAWRELADKSESTDQLVENVKALGLIPTKAKMN